MATLSASGLLPSVIQAMLQPEFYPHPANNLELRQTHTSYVLLAGEFVYKVRKAVRFAFIDCSTVPRRLALCRRELELNRRLSPDIYLAVVAIEHRGDKFMLASADESPDAIEFAVKMRRLPQARRLDLMLQDGTASADDVRAIARHVGSFHSSAPNSKSWTYGAAASIWRMVAANLAEIERLRPDALLLNKIVQIEAYSRRFVGTHWELLNRRARGGWVHEGHGDLRADAVYLTADGIRIIDCLEFDERLRYGDIANEVAFLAMDLERLGRPDLSEQLAACFVGDPDFARLIPFYKSCRATVRAKVELLRSLQPDCSEKERQITLASATTLLEVALRSTQAPKALIIVCGASGTGKSTFAALLSEYLHFEVLSSDVVRKRLAGVEPHISAAASYNQGIYTPESTERVYGALLAEAKRVLDMGHGVILDATFGRRRQRKFAVEVAEQTSVEPRFIECRAAKDLIIQRLSERARSSSQVSDATAEIYLAQIKEFEPLDEIPAIWHHVVDTAGHLPPQVEEIDRRLYAERYSKLTSA